MDALSRRRRMQGYEVLWLPGMDHAAIAMQTMVERKLATEGKTRDDWAATLHRARLGREGRDRRQHRRADASPR